MREPLQDLRQGAAATALCMAGAGAWRHIQSAHPCFRRPWRNQRDRQRGGDSHCRRGDRGNLRRDRHGLKGFITSVTDLPSRRPCPTCEQSVWLVPGLAGSRLRTEGEMIPAGLAGAADYLTLASTP